MKKKIRDMTFGELLDLEFNLSGDEKDETAEKESTKDDFEVRPDLIAMATGTPTEVVIQEKKYRVLLDQLAASIPEEVVATILETQGPEACANFAAEVKTAFLNAVSTKIITSYRVSKNLDQIDKYVESASTIKPAFNPLENTTPIGLTSFEETYLNTTPLADENRNNIVDLLEQKQDFIDAVMAKGPFVAPQESLNGVE